MGTGTHGSRRRTRKQSRWKAKLARTAKPCGDFQGRQRLPAGAVWLAIEISHWPPTQSSTTGDTTDFSREIGRTPFSFPFFFFFSFFPTTDGWSRSGLTIWHRPRRRIWICDFQIQVRIACNGAGEIYRPVLPYNESMFDYPTTKITPRRDWLSDARDIARRCRHDDWCILGYFVTHRSLDPAMQSRRLSRSRGPVARSASPDWWSLITIN